MLHGIDFLKDPETLQKRTFLESPKYMSGIVVFLSCVVFCRMLY